MRNRANVAIIGGGVIGLSVAYNLAKKGITDVVLLERGYLGRGASGRNSGGVRVSFNAPETIMLAKENIKRIRQLSQTLEYDILFKQNGYLFLAYTEDQVGLAKENVKRQNSLGLKTKMLANNDISEIAPSLNLDGVLAAAFDPYAGYVDPDAVVRGYAIAARKLGVEIDTFMEVKDIHVDSGEISSVETSHGTLKTSVVVDAAGAYSPILANMAGVDLPSRSYRREMVITEPLKPFIGPMIISLDSGVHFHQSVHHGGIIGGMPPRRADPVTYRIDSSVEFLKELSTELIRLCPKLRRVNVLRQWAGLLDYTPDSSPILGEVDDVHGLILASGWSGHGFQLAPIIGRLLAELIAEGKTSISIEAFNLRRFEEGKLIKEKMSAFAKSTRVLLGLKEEAFGN